MLCAAPCDEAAVPVGVAPADSAAEAPEVPVSLAVDAVIFVAGNRVSVCVPLPLLMITRFVAEGDSDIMVPE